MNPQAAAIVLIGGASSRMGTDKAALVVDGVSMLDRVMTALSGSGVTPVAVVGGEHVADAQSVIDPAPHAGPLAGIVGGWRHLCASAVTPDPIVVLSCDLPSLTAAAVTELVVASANHRHGALAHDGERPQPLIAAYRPEALMEFEIAFEAGIRSPRRCFDGWDLGHVLVQRDIIADADSPDDLRGFEVEWPS